MERPSASKMFLNCSEIEKKVIYLSPAILFCLYFLSILVSFQHISLADDRSIKGSLQKKFHVKRKYMLYNAKKSNKYLLDIVYVG